MSEIGRKFVIELQIPATGAAWFIGCEVKKQLSDTGQNGIALDGLVEGLYSNAEKLSRLKNA